MHSVRELFDNDSIISVESNFSLDKPVYDIEYIISYKDTYSEKQLVDFL